MRIFLNKVLKNICPKRSPTQGRFVDFYFFVRNRVIVGEKPSTPSLFPKIDQLLPLKYPSLGKIIGGIFTINLACMFLIAESALI